MKKSPYAVATVIDSRSVRAAETVSRASQSFDITSSMSGQLESEGGQGLLGGLLVLLVAAA